MVFHAICLRIVRCMRELRQQRFSNLSADDRVLKKAASITVNLWIRQFSHSHMADRIEYLLRGDCLRIETC